MVCVLCKLEKFFMIYFGDIKIRGVDDSNSFFCVKNRFNFGKRYRFLIDLNEFGSLIVFDGELGVPNPRP